MNDIKKSLKVMTIIGTRPEIIRLAEIIKKLDKFCHHILVHTGQNYNYELNTVFFEFIIINLTGMVQNVMAKLIELLNNLGQSDNFRPSTDNRHDFQGFLDIIHVFLATVVQR